VPELADVDDVRLTKTDRPSDYPEPIVDHSAERSEALRRYQGIT
jgi:deoxyribodipyrimidine photo-lyase